MAGPRVAARIRVRLYDKDGRLVEERLLKSHSFTYDFAQLLWSMFYYSPSPPLPWVDVNSNIFNLKQPYAFLCIVGCPGLSAYSSSAISTPGIALGTNTCVITTSATAPCGTILTSLCCPVLSPSAPSVSTVAGPSQQGWTMSVSQSFTNVSNAPATVQSAALVTAVYDVASPGVGYLYAPLVDNISPAITVNPGYMLQVQYTIEIAT